MARGRTGKRGSAAGKRRTQKKRMTKRVLTGGTKNVVYENWETETPNKVEYVNWDQITGIKAMPDYMNVPSKGPMEGLEGDYVSVPANLKASNMQSTKITPASLATGNPVLQVSAQQQVEPKNYYGNAITKLMEEKNKGAKITQGNIERIKVDLLTKYANNRERVLSEMKRFNTNASKLSRQKKTFKLW